MLFNSYDFIFYFLPITFAGYFLLNHFQKYKIATLFLTLASLFFYGYYKISYVWIILCSILVNYIVHLTLLSPRKKLVQKRKHILVCGIVTNLGILFYFKYFNFALEIVSAITDRTITFSQIALPLGISFFTFQQIGFIVDSYKQTISRQPLVSYALFVSFFPQLIAGPIVNHQEMLPAFENIENKKIQLNNLYQGIQIFIIGLAKKILIADIIGNSVNWGYAHYTLLDGFNTLLVFFMYSLQLYFDFSGYCDMARGLGYLFNIRIPLNFNSPFKSGNIVDFWKRWHITLGRFFTKYLYIPLGGNRRGFARTLLNIFIVFTVSGIWHGAGWTFIIWGLMHAILQVLTRIWWALKERYSLPQIHHPLLGRCIHAICIIGCFSFVAVAFGIFRADNPGQAISMIGNLTSINGIHIMYELSSHFCLKEVNYLLRVLNLDTLANAATWQMIVFLLIVSIITWGCKNTYETESNSKNSMIKLLFLAALFTWSVLSLSGVSNFLYFNF